MELFTQKFEEMYKAHYSLLCNTAQNITCDLDASHDIVQEVFLSLLNKKESPEHILNHKAYLMKAVINASVKHLAKRKTKVNVETTVLSSDMRSDTSTELKDLQKSISLALNKLPVRCKAIFVLSRFEGIKNKEIASLMGLSVKTVENQMGIALKKMRQDLEPFLSGKSAVAGILTGVLILSRFLFFTINIPALLIILLPEHQ